MSVPINASIGSGLRGETKNIRITMPIEPIDRYDFAKSSGKIVANILLPSSGGIGKRLKIAREILIVIVNAKNVPKNPLEKTWKNVAPGKIRCATRAAIAARIKFVPGPASEMIAISFRGSLRLNGSTGTGFAPPKTRGNPVGIVAIKVISGKRIVITGSMCGIGFSVNLPSSLAVGSPSLSATRPCAISWRITERIMIVKEMIISSKFINIFYQIL